MNVLNEYRVPKKQWSKWAARMEGNRRVKDSLPRLIFNKTMVSILGAGPDCFLHPKTLERGITEDEFYTIAWNSAWLAAEAVKKPDDVVSDYNPRNIQTV